MSKEFVKFSAGDFSLNNALLTDRPVVVVSDQIETLDAFKLWSWRGPLTVDIHEKD